MTWTSIQHQNIKDIQVVLKYVCSSTVDTNLSQNEEHKVSLTEVNKKNVSSGPILVVITIYLQHCSSVGT